MLKILSLIMLAGLLINVQGYCAEKSINSTSTANYEYNFDDSSFNISDEQFKEAEQVEETNEEQTFDSKVINSGHFSSTTATRTWIPFRRNRM